MTTLDPQTLQNAWETYVSAWKANSIEAKQNCLANVAETCIYTDPITQTHGQQALVDYMMQFHQQIPGGYFQTQKFMAHHNQSVAIWTMHDANGATLGDGVSYGTYNDEGKLITMTGFFDLPTT